MPPLPIIGGGALTVGASAPIFGLLGALMYYGRRGGSSLVRSAVMGYVMSAVMFGIYAAASTTTRTRAVSSAATWPGCWLDPLKPERMDHMVDRRGLPGASAASPSPRRSSTALWPTLMR